MINTGIQKISVVGYQNKSLFGGEILFHDIAGISVQMIGWLINQQKVMVSGK